MGEKWERKRGRARASFSRFLSFSHAHTHTPSTPFTQKQSPEYIASWWNVVNWERVSEAYEAALKGEVLL
jgi:hypothetical protein